MAPDGRNETLEGIKGFFMDFWHSTRDIAGIALSFFLGMTLYREGNTYAAIFFIAMSYLALIGYGFHLREIVKAAKKAEKEGEE